MKTTPTPLYVEQLRQIAERALALMTQCDAGPPKMPERWKSYVRSAIALADISCPMRLDQLLTFPDEDFAHDVFGVLAHLDANTGRLRNCFDPRCSAPYHEAVQ